MKITTTVEVTLTAKAVLRDGELSVSLAASVPYGEKGRTATPSVDTFPAELLDALRDALQAITNYGQDEAIKRAQADAMASLKQALDRKEEV